jgi:hypothetical protein
MLGISIFSRLEQLSKAYVSIDLTVLGILIDTREWQSSAND